MSLCHHRVDAPSLALSPHSSLSRAARQYDRVFAPHCAQETVFDAVQPLVVSVLDGYNVCVFAYGQTGSGKTFTIEGTADDPGVSPRAVAELFRIVGERSPDWSFTVTMCMLEVCMQCGHHTMHMNCLALLLDLLSRRRRIRHTRSTTRRFVTCWTLLPPLPRRRPRERTEVPTPAPKPPPPPPLHPAKRWRSGRPATGWRCPA